MESKYEHGDWHRYDGGGCRCGACRAAWTEYARTKRAARREAAATGKIPEKVHGTVGGSTNHGCSCPLCKKAIRDYREATAKPSLDEIRREAYLEGYEAGEEAGKRMAAKEEYDRGWIECILETEKQARKGG